MPSTAHRAYAPRQRGRLSSHRWRRTRSCAWAPALMRPPTMPCAPGTVSARPWLQEANAHRCISISVEQTLQERMAGGPPSRSQGLPNRQGPRVEQEGGNPGLQHPCSPDTCHTWVRMARHDTCRTTALRGDDWASGASCMASGPFNPVKAEMRQGLCSKAVRDRHGDGHQGD